MLLTPTNGLFLASLVTFVIVTALPFASKISKVLVVATTLRLGMPTSLIAFIISSGDAIIAALDTAVYVFKSAIFSSSPVLPLSSVIVLAPEPLLIVNCGF